MLRVNGLVTIGHLGGKIFMCMNNIGYNIILASNSPRRKELLAGLGVDEDDDEAKDAMSIVNLLQENLDMWNSEDDD